ncbi:MAG: chitobiase/beta-hexosaminidase C-terminal domain-containing protein [archaeon]|jgi:hypothetical protein
MFKNKKNKGQVSIEILIILSVLIIGTIIFGTYYVSHLNSNITNSKNTTDAKDNLVDCFVDPTSSGCSPNSGTTPPTPTVVATPVAYPLPQNVTSETQITLTSATSGATIYYTTNGIDPVPLNSNTFVYNGSINIASYPTIKAIAIKTGMTNSSVATFIYTPEAPEIVATPTAIPVSGTHLFAQSVTLNTVTTGATIRYTLDGTEPIETSTQYTTPIQINSTKTLKAKAFLAGWTASTTATFNYIIIACQSGGLGTAASPFVICTPKELFNIRDAPSLYYLLGQDIDLDVTLYNSGLGWEPIGVDNHPFTGSFDGNGHTISNLYINRPIANYVGLFGYIDDGAIISNVKLENVNIIGNDSVGSLIGRNNNGIISSSYSTGEVNGKNYVGGLIGNLIEGSISLSNFNGNVFGDLEVGGLVGINYGTISKSNSIGNVSGNQINAQYFSGEDMGGLVGVNVGLISNSYSKTEVIGSTYVGGLVGFNHCAATIDSSYSTGNVSGRFEVGGLVGIYVDASFGCLVKEIKNSYSTGNVTRQLASISNEHFGGFIGQSSIDAEINNCYSTGKVIYESDSGKPINRGFSGTTVISSGMNFWNIDTSLQSTSPSVATGLSNEAMQNIDSFQNLGWNFTTIWAINPSINNGYPYLKQIPPQPTVSVTSNPLPGTYNVSSLSITLSSSEDGVIYYTINGSNPVCDSGTSYSSPIAISIGTTIIKAIGCKEGFDSRILTFEYILPPPIIILTATDLNNVRNDLNKSYILGADIDLGVSPYNIGNGWLPIGAFGNSFNGTFDGNGHTIKNLYINRTPSYVGLFGIIGTNSKIKNLTLEDINATGSSYVGGLVGYNYGGTISDINSTGVVFVTGVRGGGLVGESEFGNISNCIFDGNVSGNINSDNVGGLIGRGSGVKISKSHSTGNVSSIAQGVGGLIGYSEGGLISLSYSECMVSGSSNVGGFIGEYDFSTATDGIYSCYSTGDVIGNSFVGGFVGSNRLATIGNCYSLGDVTRKSGSEITLGGFIGYGYPDLSQSTNYNSYSIGRVIYNGGNSPVDKGFSGTSVSGSRNVWDRTASLQTSSPSGAAGVTTEALKNSSQFPSNSGWNFTTIWAFNPSINNGYPYLQQIPPQ